jgi:hypothetical protein
MTHPPLLSLMGIAHTFPETAETVPSGKRDHTLKERMRNERRSNRE